MKIAFTGTHSTGKTTLLNILREDPKFSGYHFADEITRVIKKEGYSINEKGGDETQKRIMQDHLENSRYERVIMDRCSLDGFCYTKYLYEKGNVSQEVMDYAEEIHNNIKNTYNIIFYLTPEFSVVYDGVRSTNNEFRDRVAELFVEEIHNNQNLYIVPLTGTIEDRIKIINNTINTYLNNETRND